MGMTVEEIETLTGEQLRQLKMESGDDDIYSEMGIALQEEEEDCLNPQDAAWCLGYHQE